MLCLLTILVSSYLKQIVTILKKKCSIWNISSIVAPFAILRNLWIGSTLLEDPTKEKTLEWQSIVKKDYNEIKTIMNRKDVLIAEGFFESLLTSTFQFGFYLTFHSRFLKNFKWQQIECIMMKMSASEMSKDELKSLIYDGPGPWYTFHINLLIASVAMSILSMTMSQLNLYKKKNAYDESNMMIYFLSSASIAVAKWVSQTLFMKYLITLQLKVATGKSLFVPLSFAIYFLGILIFQLIESGLTYLIHTNFPGT